MGAFDLPYSGIGIRGAMISNIMCIINQVKL